MPYAYEFIVSTGIENNPVDAAAVAANRLTRYLPEATVIEATVYDKGAGVGLLVKTTERVNYHKATNEMDTLETMEEVSMEFKE